MNNQRRRDELQRLVDRIFDLLTSTSEEIARNFGDSRVKCDSDRINYALELLAPHVSAERQMRS